MLNRETWLILFKLLPDSERGLLEMRFFHNMSYRRIGQEFGVSCHCVRQAVEKILKECRRIMKYIDFGKTKGELVAIPVINEKSLLFDHDKLVAKKEERKKLRKALSENFTLHEELKYRTNFIEYCLKHYGSSWRYRVENFMAKNLRAILPVGRKAPNMITSATLGLVTTHWRLCKKPAPRSYTWY